MHSTKIWREGEIGRRPVRIANCSGYNGESAYEMYKQATLGDIDFITGDYVGEANIANNAEAYKLGQHPGYQETAWQALCQTIDVINEKRIKVAINGGALNPQGLAQKVAELIHSRGYMLKVAYVSGDNALSSVGSTSPPGSPLRNHDWENKDVTLDMAEFTFAGRDHGPAQIVSANAYMGARGIVKGFINGADIIICGRVSDVSPAIAAAWYWWSWNDQEYDCLAGALVAGALTKCSAYGGVEDKFAGFDQFNQPIFLDPGFPITEIARDGSCVITKHLGTGGSVDIDMVRSQLLCELQGTVYLHSDCKAVLDNVQMAQMRAGNNRVHIYGVVGLPPPPMSKLVVFYKGGHEVQALLNAAGYATEEKCGLVEAQLKYSLGPIAKKLECLKIQRVATPSQNFLSSSDSAVYIRVYAQSCSTEALQATGEVLSKMSLLQPYGLQTPPASPCDSLVGCTASGYPTGNQAETLRPYLGYYPAIWNQSKLNEQVHFIDASGIIRQSFSAGQPPQYEELSPRKNYDTEFPVTFRGPLQRTALGQIALARAGDKGQNLNFGIYVHTRKRWEWLKTYMTRERARKMIGSHCREWIYIERVEMPKIFAVQFVVYDILKRGVESANRMDNSGSGKGFAEYLMEQVVDVPVELLPHQHGSHQPRSASLL